MACAHAGAAQWRCVRAVHSARGCRALPSAAQGEPSEAGEGSGAAAAGARVQRGLRLGPAAAGSGAAGRLCGAVFTPRLHRLGVKVRQHEWGTWQGGGNGKRDGLERGQASEERERKNQTGKIRKVCAAFSREWL